MAGGRDDLLDDDISGSIGAPAAQQAGPLSLMV